MNIVTKDQGQRMRAARAYAGISEVDLARRIGATVDQYKGWARSFATAPPTMLDRIADETGVPRWWLRDGFEGNPYAPGRLIPRSRGDHDDRDRHPSPIEA